MQLVGFHSEPRGKALSRAVHLCAGRRGGLERVIGLHLGPPIVIGERIDHVATGIRSTGVFEVGEARERGFDERRELSTHEVEVEVFHANTVLAGAVRRLRGATRPVRCCSGCYPSCGSAA